MSVWTTLLVMFAMGGPVETNDGLALKGPRRGGPPPPAAFKACAASKAGDPCTVETPDGSKAGVCRVPPRLDKLVCVPNDHKRRKRDGEQATEG